MIWGQSSALEWEEAGQQDTEEGTRPGGRRGDASTTAQGLVGSDDLEAHVQGAGRVLVTSCAAVLLPP